MNIIQAENGGLIYTNRRDSHIAGENIDLKIKRLVNQAARIRESFKFIDKQTHSVDGEGKNRKVKHMPTPKDHAQAAA